MRRILHPSTLKNIRYIAAMLLLLFYTIVCTKAQEQKYTITTDKDDYCPGEWVIITGAGWLNNDSVLLTLTHLDPLPDPYHHHTPWFVNPDTDGNIYYKWLVLDQELGTSFELEAQGFTLGGSTSNYAVTYFKDAKITNVTVSGSSFCNGQQVTVSYTASNSGVRFGDSNIFTAQLSDASGSFSSPVIIGTLKSGQSGDINAIIPSGTPKGTHYRIRVLSSSPVIISNPNTADLTINVSPTAPASVTATPAAICPGESSNLTATSAGNTIRWYAADIGGSIIATSKSGANFSVTPANTTTYYAEALNAAGCSSPARTAVTVTVKPPPIITSTTPASVCGSGTVTLNAASSAGIINWYSNTTTGTILATGVSFTTPVITVSKTYYVDATSNGCKTATRTAVTATVNASPAAPAVRTITQPTCAVSTGSVVLNGLPATGNWTLTRTPGGTTTTGTGTSTTITGLSTGTYAFTVTNTAGCTSGSSTNVVIHAQPAAPAMIITNPAAVCSPLKVDLTATAVTAGSTRDLTFTYWTNAAATISYTTPSAADDGTYYIKGTTSSGCSNIKPVTVTVNPLPTANAGSGGNECGLNFKCDAVESIGTGTWTQTTGTGTASFSPDSNTPDAAVTVSAYGNYTFNWTESKDACSNSSTINVNFHQQPIANAGAGGTICSNEFNLGATPGSGTGTWMQDSGPGSATFIPNANTPNAKVNVNAYGTYTLRWTEVNGPCSNSATISITFIQQPSANAGIGGDECDKDFVLNAVPGAVPGVWTKINGPGNAVFSPGANQANAKVTVSQLGSYDFAWTEANTLCTSTDIIRVIFHDLPSINAGADVEVCKGGSIQLNAIGSGSFLWTPANLVNKQDISNPIATPIATSVLNVTLTDRWGCKNSDQVSIEVSEQLVANAGSDQVLEYQFETTLNAATLGNQQTGEWTIISGTGEFINKNDNATHVSNLSLDKNCFLWTLTNGVCPSSSDTVNIIVHDLTIPTLITPNKDGKNEYFIIRGIETLGKTELVIFNRWGSRVYMNSNYDNNWDGKDDNENPLPDDTYFFILKPEKSNPFRGYIVVRR